MRKNYLVLNADVREEGKPVDFYGFTVKEEFEYGFLGNLPIVITGMMTGDVEDPDVYIWMPDRRDPGQWTRTWRGYHQLYERADDYSKQALSLYLKKYRDHQEFMES